MVNYQVVDSIFVANKPQDLKNLVPLILEKAQDCKLWLFEGELGAGKTTLIQTICQSFGVLDVVSSPTYGLVHEYQNQQGQVFYHFDFYRINSEAEARDIGCEEYFYSGDYCFVEWGSQVPSIFPHPYLKIHLQVQADESRKIVIEKHD